MALSCIFVQTHGAEFIVLVDMSKYYKLTKLKVFRRARRAKGFAGLDGLEGVEGQGARGHQLHICLSSCFLKALDYMLKHYKLTRLKCY